MPRRDVPCGRVEPHRRPRHARDPGRLSAACDVVASEMRPSQDRPSPGRLPDRRSRRHCRAECRRWGALHLVATYHAVEVRRVHSTDHAVSENLARGQIRTAHARARAHVGWPENVARARGHRRIAKTAPSNDDNRERPAWPYAFLRPTSLPRAHECDRTTCGDTQPRKSR
jgi:hypothetical protein